ncbi:MAG: hypothetical protein IKV87_01750 [Methanobrevibacter sp.]|nr:hypothetical protein [Methanobrevibacter sp.]
MKKERKKKKILKIKNDRKMKKNSVKKERKKKKILKIKNDRKMNKIK